jgi:putative membrane protein
LSDQAASVSRAMRLLPDDERVLELVDVVLADEAIDAKVPSETWNEVIGVTIDGIKKGHVGLGLTAAIERCGDILATEFPIGENDVNELEDTLIIKE